MDVGTYDLSGTKIMTVDVQGCTNALEDRMSEKGHPEHKKPKHMTCFGLYSIGRLNDSNAYKQVIYNTLAIDCAK
jgi:hypothetical protein